MNLPEDVAPRKGVKAPHCVAGQPGADGAAAEGGRVPALSEFAAEPSQRVCDLGRRQTADAAVQVLHARPFGPEGSLRKQVEHLVDDLPLTIDFE